MKSKLYLVTLFFIIYIIGFPQTETKKKNLPKSKISTSQTASGKLYLRSLMYISTGKVDLSWYYLGSDGVFVKNPKNGVNPVVLASEKVNNVENTGTYKITNNKIVLSWSSGETNIKSLKFKDAEIIEMDAMGMMIRQNGLPKDYVLNGKFSGINNGGVYDFLGNHTFTRNIYENGKRVERKGNYTIKDNNLILVFSDNSKELCLIALVQDDIVINTSYYEKK